MDGKNKIDRITNALYGPGIAMAGGCDERDVPARIQALSQKSNKPYCVVAQWSIWQIPLDSMARAQLRTEGFKPRIVYATNIIDDERKRWDSGSKVRTTWLVDFRDGCIFETLNTSYILVGPGNRKTVSFHIAFGFYF